MSVGAYWTPCAYYEGTRSQDYAAQQHELFQVDSLVSRDSAMSNVEPQGVPVSHHVAVGDPQGRPTVGLAGGLETLTGVTPIVHSKLWHVFVTASPQYAWGGFRPMCNICLDCTQACKDKENDDSSGQHYHQTFLWHVGCSCCPLTIIASEITV